jgi:hypothetical protein
MKNTFYNQIWKKLEAWNVWSNKSSLSKWLSVISTLQKNEIGKANCYADNIITLVLSKLFAA